MLFIELTSMADFKTFWLNAECIVHMEQGPNEADTIIQTATDEYHVSEPMRYIIDLIGQHHPVHKSDVAAWSEEYHRRNPSRKA